MDVGTVEKKSKDDYKPHALQTLATSDTTKVLPLVWNLATGIRLGICRNNCADVLFQTDFSGLLDRECFSLHGRNLLSPFVRNISGPYLSCNKQPATSLIWF